MNRGISREHGRLCDEGSDPQWSGGNMTAIALSTGSLYTYGIARVFELAAQAGFDAVEVLVDQRWDSRQPSYLRRLSSATGLPIVAIHSPFAPQVPGWPHEPVGRLQNSARLARAVGSTVLVAHLPFRFPAIRFEVYGGSIQPRVLPVPVPLSRDYERFLRQDLAEFEAAEGIVVGIENMPARRVLGGRVSLYRLNKPEILASLPHLTLDTTHLGTCGLDPVAIYRQLQTRVVHVHLSNFDGKEHRLVEDGHLPLAGLLRELAKQGYRGAVSVELGPEQLEAEDEDLVLAHLCQAVSFCRTHLTL